MSRGRRISLTLAGLVVIFCLLEGLFRSSGETVHVIGIERLRPEILGRELDHDGDGTIARHDGRTERSPTVPSASSTGTLEWARRL
jgi:hypothetical protein